MQKTKFSRILSVILCVMLITATALFTSGCTDKETHEPPKETVSVTKLGEGEKSFYFSVTDGDGKETAFEIHTDKTIVGEALQDLGLISGDEGPYGLYVKTVNNTTYDYDTDGKYWAFYINGEYAPTGVDVTEIDESASYSFRAEK